MGERATINVNVDYPCVFAIYSDACQTKTLTSVWYPKYRFIIRRGASIAVSDNDKNYVEIIMYEDREQMGEVSIFSSTIN